MHDAECVAFLQWALPMLQLRWAGFRKVRRQVCKRVARRLHVLDIADTAAYRKRLAQDPGEWRVLDSLCRVTISRFYRDKQVFDFVADRMLPALAARAAASGRSSLEIWSAGCGSGEEAYTLALIVAFARLPESCGIAVNIQGTDAEPAVIERARRACYPAGCLKEIPIEWLERAFVSRAGLYCLRPEYTSLVTLSCQDLRDELPAGPFDLILCRNLAFTYFDETLQRRVASRLCDRLVPGGGLVLGAHERLPPGTTLVPWSKTHNVYTNPPTEAA